MSPSLFARTDLAKYKNGASTVRNCFINYRGGASSRAGLAYVGMCKQGAPNAGGTPTSNPPRDIKFQFNLNQGYALEFGDQYMRVKSNGAYVTEAAKTVTSVSTAGLFTVASHGFSNGDWVYDVGNAGFTGLTWIVQNATTNTFTLTDLFGTAINSATASSGGTVSRIYTAIAPYAAVDLPYLKFTQSADTMSLTCLNQQTNTEYIPYDLVRNGASNWTFTATTFSTSISPPTSITVTAQNSTTVSTWYSYLVTAVSSLNGDESIASAAGSAQNNDISVYAGTNTITWPNVTNAAYYNVYKATPAYGAQVPYGVNYGYLGQAFGTQFVDTNISADFSKTPPSHSNPFARGAILDVVPTAVGSGYAQNTTTVSITTSTGSGAVIIPIVVSGSVVAFIIQDGGSGYVPADTIAITGAGTLATATLTVGPQTGTYPSVVNYYQQRRVYANTINNPNTYYMSQPGSYTNFDAATPTIDSDAITGTPWAQQINGVQFMQPMPGGLIVLSGNGAWQVSGGNNTAITPSDQSAVAQSYNGCSSTVAPQVVNYDILYVQSNGSIIRDLAYNFYVNIYTGTDLTILSNHLFNFYTIKQWAWAEEPFKVMWVVRNDGVLLSLTYLKEQDIYAWARHDTNGLFVSVCSVTEPPVDAIYAIVQRYINGVWVYYSERMDDRNWSNSEKCFCVDSGLTYLGPAPSATLTAAAAQGTNNVSSINLIYGGKNYTSPSALVVDASGSGFGAKVTLTVAGGVITGYTITAQGQNYNAGQTTIVITDSTGSGAVLSPIITNNVTFTASSSVFNSGSVGSVIRMGGGSATITSYVSGTQVVANITQPITQVLPNNFNNVPVPATAGNWTISVPVSSVSGLNHLNGQTVSILADGSVMAQQVVSNGSITLPAAYSYITVGLPYTAQVQTLYLDPHEGQADTPQGKRKSIPFVILRVEDSRGFSAGTNQPDASVQPNQATVPWKNMIEAKERNASIAAGSAIPLYTGDSYVGVNGSWNSNGQVAVQQTYPLPLNLLGLIVPVEVGDTQRP